MKRRYFVNLAALSLVSIKSLLANQIQLIIDKKNNFKYIYSNKKLKKEFLKFLKNVFNLYPETDFHNLIDETTKIKNNDKEIYLSVQSKLDDIDSLLSPLTYQLPALKKQKEEMAKEAYELLKSNKKEYNGYLEIGSSGRYLDYLEEKIEISGERYYADGKEPGYSVTEMINRGQIGIGANYVPFTSYKTNYTKFIPKNSLDLVTIYIGFHHCPIDLRVSFITSIKDTMRSGGKMILRDHDCNSDEQKVIVALAHDVFNLGTNETWETNEKEIRNFYSLDFIIKFIENLGFKFENRTLFQEGDPTKNALMLFTKL